MDLWKCAKIFARFAGVLMPLVLKVATLIDAIMSRGEQGYQQSNYVNMNGVSCVSVCICLVFFGIGSFEDCLILCFVPQSL